MLCTLVCAVTAHEQVGSSHPAAANSDSVFQARQSCLDMGPPQMHEHQLVIISTEQKECCRRVAHLAFLQIVELW